METRVILQILIIGLCASVYRCNAIEEVPKNNATTAAIKENAPAALAEPPRQKDKETEPLHVTNATVSDPKMVVTTAMPTTSSKKPDLATTPTLTKAKGREGVSQPPAIKNTEPNNGPATPQNTVQPVLSTPVVHKIDNTTEIKKNETKATSPSTTPASTSTTKAATTSTTTTTTKTTTTTTSTTTTTTPKPKKPTITYSALDEPSIANVTRGKLHDRVPSKLNDDNILEQPNAQPSLEFTDVPSIHKDYFIPILAMIFAVPIVMGAIIVLFRRFKDYWSTRHYRRMDFLVDGMYND